MVSEELTQVFDTAIYKEIASEAFYIAGQSRTQDSGARALMRELASEELKHSEHLKELKDSGLSDKDWHQDRVPGLMITEYLTGGDSLEGAGLQDTLIFAMKREQEAVEFYSKLMAVMGDEVAKRLCARLVEEELEHKLKLEILYDNLFYGED